MIRVVLDTNIIVSAYLNHDGLPFSILKLALTGIIRLCVSEPILSEYEELLHRKSYPLDRGRARLLLKHLRLSAEMFRPSGSLNIANDPDDNIFLECAQVAKAHFLVTGNTDDFPMKRWKYTDVVTPRMFINNWKDLHPGDKLPLR